VTSTLGTEAADEKTLSKTIARYGRVDLRCLDELGHMQLDRSVGEGCLAVTRPRGRVLTDARAAPDLEEGSPWPSCSM
jgi:hypothetical protein